MEENIPLFQRYHDEANSGLSPATIKLDSCILRRFENFVQKPMMDVTKDDIINYFKSLKLSPYTIEQHRCQIKKFFKWLYHSEETGKVPPHVSWIKINRKRVYKFKTEADILTKDELNELLEACKNPLERAMIAVLYDSATRIGEFTRLKIGDVVHKDNNISIVVDGKTGQRAVPLTEISIGYLTEYLKLHPTNKNRNAPMWICNRNRGYSVNGMHSIITSIAKRTTIDKKVTCHIFRHSRLTDIARSGTVSEAAMRLFAGWSKDSNMPAVYLHLTADDVRNAIMKVDNNTFRETDTIEQRVEQRLAEEKQKIHDEVLQQLLETLKDPQHEAIQEYLFAQSEQP